MVVLGALMAALSIAIGRVLAVVTPLADLAVLGLGVLLLAGRNPFTRLPALSVRGGPSHPALAAYVYGLLYGPIALPCSGALLVSAFTLSLSLADYAGRLLFFAVFGLGFGLPLLGLSLLAEGRQRALVRVFARHDRVVTRLAGAVLVAVGAWDLSANLPFALLYLSTGEVLSGTA